MVHASICPEDTIACHTPWASIWIFGCSPMCRGADPAGTLEVLLRWEGKDSSALFVSPVSDEERVRCYRGGGCER